MTHQCYIPHCKNARDMSKKFFISIPTDLKEKQTWLTIVGIRSTKSKYCCEDHFHLPSDLIDEDILKYNTANELECYSLNLTTKVPPSIKLPRTMVCATCFKPAIASEYFCLNTVAECPPKVINIYKEKKMLWEILQSSLPHVYEKIQLLTSPLLCKDCHMKLWKLYKCILFCTQAMKKSIYSPLKSNRCYICRSANSKGMVEFSTRNQIGKMIKDFTVSELKLNQIYSLCKSCHNQIIENSTFRDTCNIAKNKYQFYLNTHKKRTNLDIYEVVKMFEPKSDNQITNNNNNNNNTQKQVETTSIDGISPKSTSQNSTNNVNEIDPDKSIDGGSKENVQSVIIDLTEEEDNKAPPGAVEEKKSCPTEVSSNSSCLPIVNANMVIKSEVVINNTKIITFCDDLGEFQLFLNDFNGRNFNCIGINEENGWEENLCAKSKKRRSSEISLEIPEKKRKIC